MQTKIKPLSKERLDETRRMAKEIFEGDSPEDTERLLRASLDPEEYRRYLEGAKIVPDLRYWIAILDEAAVGIVGLYHTTPGYFWRVREPRDGEKLTWLGEYGVLREHRGKGIGGGLLGHAETVAEDEGHTSLVLWTANTGDPEETLAHSQFEKRGYEKIVDYKGRQILVYEKKLWVPEHHEEIARPALVAVS